MTTTACHVLTALSVVNAAAQAVGVKPRAVTSRIRTADVTLARHIAMYILRERYYLSFPEIGRMLDRDHSSVMYGYRRIRDADQGDLEITQAIAGTYRVLRNQRQEAT